MLHAFEEYERRLHQILANAEYPDPGTPAGREEIRHRVNRVLRISPAWRPAIRAETVAVSDAGLFQVETLQFESWDRIFGYALWYLPRTLPCPAILINPGHDAGGKFGYQKMAQILAAGGCAVLLADAFGLGEREYTGHRQSFRVFDCGTTVAGLIVLEALGWLDWLKQNSKVIPEKIGVAGNSGGGQTTTLMCANAPEEFGLAVCGGFPSSFEFTIRKTRPLCACTMFPGIAGQFEMVHCYAAFAPKPLMLVNGQADNMFPRDLLLTLKQNLESFWPENDFTVLVAEGAHSWADDKPRYEAMANFIFEHFELPKTTLDKLPESIFPALQKSGPVPENAETIDSLAARLGAVPLPPMREIYDIFPPEFIPENSPEPLRKLFAQLELYLEKGVSDS
jgi:dienelactone hydrolase